jgi:hypothetical protein
MSEGKWTKAGVLIAAIGVIVSITLKEARQCIGLDPGGCPFFASSPSQPNSQSKPDATLPATASSPPKSDSDRRDLKTPNQNSSTPLPSTTLEPSTQPDKSSSFSEPEVKTSSNLDVEKVLIGIKNPTTQKIDPVTSAKFKLGDTVALVLINVGKFRKGTDGKHLFDMDMEVQDNQGKVLGKKERLLGSGGNLFLPNDIAKSPYGSIDTGVTKLKAGEYKIILNIYDKISGSSTQRSKSFILENPSANFTQSSLPAFPVGSYLSSVEAKLGKPHKQTSGLWGTQALSYKLVPNHMEFGYLFDPSSGILKQTEATFDQSVDLQLMLRNLDELLDGKSTEDIKQGLRRVYQGERNYYTLLLGAWRVQIVRQNCAHIYISIWDANLHNFDVESSRQC